MLVDLLHASRALRRSPASAVAAVLTLSLTFGVGAAIFAVIDAVVLTPPPVADPDSLVYAGETPIAEPAAALRAVPYATFEAWRTRAASIAAVEAVDGTNLTLTGLGSAERLEAADVTPGFLTLLGVAPALGRGFVAGDVGHPVAIVSYAFWHGQLAGDRAVIGRQILLGGRAHTIVGVLPERSSSPPLVGDIWRPLSVPTTEAVRTGLRVRVIARLAHGTSPVELTTVFDEASRAATPPARAVAVGLTTTIAGRAKRTLGLVAGAAATAMLIALVNLAGLLVVRSIDRQRELAVRSALGARRSDVVRQLLLEAIVLGAAGIAGGALLSSWLTPVAARLAVDQFGAIANREVALSWRTIGVVSAVAGAGICLCALVPALLAIRRSLVDGLRRGGTAPGHELVLRRVLVSSEVALAFVLLVSMTLLGRSLLDVLAVDPGFDVDGVLATSVSLPAARYSDDERVASFYSALQNTMDDRLGPGTASFVDELPLTGDDGRRQVSLNSTDVGLEAVVRAAGPGYFDVMRTPIVAGRGLSSRDDASAPLRAVISQRLATRLFGSQPAIGRQIFLRAAADAVEVIGVAGDVTHRALDEAPVPTVYLSASQAPSRSSRIVVRSASANAQVIAAVRDAVAGLDRDLPVYRTQTMREVLNLSPGVPARRLLAATFLGFAVLAVALGAIGLFGVVAHDVARRRQELALRLALGAHPLRIMRATIGQSLVMVSAGLLVGTLLSVWAARVLSGLTFMTGRLDLLSVGAPAAILTIAGLTAVLPVARRAALTDPLIALRSE